MINTQHTPTSFKVTGDWAAQSRQLKETFSQLTDADLKFEVGKEPELLARLETKLNKKRDEVVAILNDRAAPAKGEVGL